MSTEGRIDGRSLRRAALAIAVVLLALAPFVLGTFAVSLLNDIGIGALVALGLVLLTGIGGATSFGQAAFVGVAAYATAWLTTVHGASPWLGLVFALSGTFIAITETLEDSFCAELVGEEHHGTAFGVLATVNGAGDFLSSIMVGVLWTAFGTSTAFSYSAILFFLGAMLVLRANKTAVQV